MESGPRWFLGSALLFHTRRVKMNKSAAGLWIFRSRKRQEFQKTLTVFPSVSSTWWTKRKQQWLNAFPLLWETSRVLSSQKMEATACSPSPLSPIPHIEAQTRALAHPRRRTREICGDYNPTFWKNHSQVRTDARQRQRRRAVLCMDSHLSPWTLLS